MKNVISGIFIFLASMFGTILVVHIVRGAVEDNPLVGFAIAGIALLAVGTAIRLYVDAHRDKSGEDDADR